MHDGLAEDGQRPFMAGHNLLPCGIGREEGGFVAMRWTCSEARKVLVLDSTSYYYDRRDLHLAEVNAWILNSACIWTLREGGLAHDLSVQFEDGPLRLSILWERLIKLSREDFKYRRLLHDT